MSEPRWHVSIGVAVAVAVQVALALTLLGDGLRSAGVALAAVQLVFGAILLGASLTDTGHGTRTLRTLGLGVVVLASLANLVALIVLVDRLLGGGRLVDGEALTANRLLQVGGLVWLSNVLVFALWYWELDRGGPAARADADPAVPATMPGFLYPQMTSPELFPGWQPRFVDYLYTSWTNATAFSPTDTLPTTRWAKAAMLLQSGISLTTAALVIARAVNILGGG